MNARIVASCLILSFAACQVKPAEVSPSAAATQHVAAAPPAQAQGDAPDERSPITLVTDRSQVCMVNNQFMGRPQIPVTIGSNVYYGCCEMCKGRLANDASARTATDPLSGRAIDKAVAVIGRTGDGSTLYFENEANFAAYSRRTRVQ
jgi:YHS domain-containing protein